MTKISQLSSIGDSLAVNDQFLIRDVDDTTTPNKSVTVSGITRALDVGSATAPAIAFATDKNTGIYSPGADQVAISTNGTGRVFVDASGRVGLGIVSSTAEFLVGQNQSPQLRVGSDASFYAGISHDFANAIVTIGQYGNFGGAAMRFLTQGTERLRITSAGLVGIGTSSPGTLLEVVQSAANTNANLITIKNSSYNVGESASLLFAHGNAPTSRISSYLPGSNQTNLTFHTCDSSSVLQQRMTIDGSGRVGIGTTSPNGLIHGYINANAQLIFQNSSQNNLYVSGTNATVVVDATGSSYPGFLVKTGGTSVGSLGADGTNTLDLGASSSTTPITFKQASAERARIDSAGRIGIGTSSPGSYSASFNNLVLSTATNCGITIVSGTAGSGTVAFADGTTGNEAFRGYVQYQHSVDALLLGTSGTERLRIDSLGRLLLGTSSNIVDSTALFQGTSGPGVLTLTSSSSAPANGAFIGAINFSDVNQLSSAQIGVQRDGGTWSGASQPTRLVFATTADGASSPTERLRITSTGQVRLAGAGITFNGDTATANELDDYEEGTWTPTATPSTSGTITLSGITASYTKIGNTVSIRMFATVSAVSSPLGYIDISLPFANSGSAAGSVLFYNGDTGAVMSNFIGRVTGNIFRITYGTGQTGTNSAPYARANTEIDIAAVYRN